MRKKRPRTNLWSGVRAFEVGPESGRGFGATAASAASAAAAVSVAFAVGRRIHQGTPGQLDAARVVHVDDLDLDRVQ